MSTLLGGTQRCFAAMVLIENMLESLAKSFIHQASMALLMGKALIPEAWVTVAIIISMPIDLRVIGGQKILYGLTFYCMYLLSHGKDLTHTWRPFSMEVRRRS